MKFENSRAFLLLIPALPIIRLLLRQKTHLGFSTFKLIKGALTIRFDLLQKIFLTIVIFAVVAVLAGPYIEIAEKVTYQEARDLVIALDVSGSMEIKFQGEEKLETAERVVREFVETRAVDRIALISFESSSQLEWPLSFAEETSGRHDPILQKLEVLKVAGGTDIAKALLATLEHFDQMGESKGRAAILVSDGISTILPQDSEKITSRIEEREIHLYWIWIKGNTTDLPSPWQSQSIITITQLVDEVNGRIFETTPEDLAEAFDEIGKLETSPVTFKEETKKIHRFQPFLLIALAALVPVVILEFIKEV